MITRSKRKVTLQVVESPKEFEQILEKERRSLQLLMEWTLEAIQEFSVSSGGEAAKRFREARKKDPYHLHFRAFAEDVEYAWFGQCGLWVGLTQQGGAGVEVEVDQVRRYDRHHSLLQAQQLLQEGRVIYEKLVPQQPRGHSTLPEGEEKQGGRQGGA